MNQLSRNPSGPQPRPRYTWPWFILAGVLLAIVLAILWVSREVERTRRLQQWNSPEPAAPSK